MDQTYIIDKVVSTAKPKEFISDLIRIYTRLLGESHICEVLVYVISIVIYPEFLQNDQTHRYAHVLLQKVAGPHTKGLTVPKSMYLHPSSQDGTSIPAPVNVPAEKYRD